MKNSELPKVIDYFTALTNRNSDFDIDCQSVIDEDNENMCETSHEKDANINNIVSRYEKTGYLDPFLTQRKPVYGDFTQYQDFQDNLNTVIAAQDAFDLLPAIVRKKFDNDVAKMMQFLDDPKNTEEAITLGLREKPKPEAPPQKVFVTNTQTPPPEETPKTKTSKAP